MPTRSQVIQEARSLIGIGETPPGSNHNSITAAYGEDGAWCAMTTWYVWHALGVDLRKLYTAQWASTVAGANAAKTRGDWRAGLAGIQPGDLVYYQVPGGDPGYVNHTGIYVDTPVFDTVVSIDGNWANRCQEVRHARRDVIGHIDMSRFITAPKPAASVPPFPGRSFFHVGAYNQHVTEVDKQLVRLGYTRHNDGINGYNPGPRYTEYTRENVQDFQHAQGWTGSDADGNVGPVTWERLFTVGR